MMSVPIPENSELPYPEFPQGDVESNDVGHVRVCP
jgi:hypothetical protein